MYIVQMTLNMNKESSNLVYTGTFSSFQILRGNNDSKQNHIYLSNKLVCMYVSDSAPMSGTTPSGTEYGQTVKCK